MNAKDTLKKIKTMLGIQIALEQMNLDNGTVIEAEVFEAGYDVFIVSGEEKIALPVGEYTLEDGRKLIISIEGIIAEIKEAEEVAPEAVTEPEMQVEPTAPKKVIESISKEMFFAEIEKLRNEIAELKLSKEEKPKEVELSEESKPIVHNPEGKAEKEINLYATQRVMTTKDRVFNKLFNN